MFLPRPRDQRTPTLKANMLGRRGLWIWRVHWEAPVVMQLRMRLKSPRGNVSSRASASKACTSCCNGPTTNWCYFQALANSNCNSANFLAASPESSNSSSDIGQFQLQFLLQLHQLLSHSWRASPRYQLPMLIIFQQRIDWWSNHFRYKGGDRSLIATWERKSFFSSHLLNRWPPLSGKMQLSLTLKTQFWIFRSLTDTKAIQESVWLASSTLWALTPMMLNYVSGSFQSN